MYYVYKVCQTPVLSFINQGCVWEREGLQTFKHDIVHIYVADHYVVACPALCDGAHLYKWGKFSIIH
jgi:hypothetical protein